MQDQSRADQERRLCALVVEDEAFIRMDAAAVLAEAGFVVIEAADAREALATLNAGTQVDLLFTDLNMPGMNGLDLTAIVHTRWPKVAILMTSGREDIPPEVIPDHGLFLDKPYLPHQLVQAAKQTLAKAG